jgi:hypothetical protein
MRFGRKTSCGFEMIKAAEQKFCGIFTKRKTG